MFKWFVETAPVRTKLLVSFAIQFALVALCGAAAALLGHDAVVVCAAALAVSAAAGHLCRKGIAEPYVTTVERMEALAAGDVKTPIRFTNYTDCVGRMTVAMDVFRKNLLAREAAEADAEAARAGIERQREQAAAQAAAELKENLIDQLAHGLEQLAAGDLRFRITRPFPAEYEKLRQDFNNAIAALQGTIVNVAASMRAVRAGAGEMTSATDDLSRRTEQQAASLEQTSAALEQITATVRQSADGAKEARDLVERAKTNAERSGEVIRETIGAMGNIENSARQISNIIVLIDEIAFQTNLLALNAGVEAARAGDAGRGFAVVATEVRALAQRSAEAAKEIKTLIQTSGAQVENGVKLVGQTGEMLGHIVTEVARLNQVIVGIASSAQEQATGMSEVNTAVGQMDRMTQQNAAMVEQSTAASHSLAKEAEELAGLLNRFKTGDAAAEPGAAPAPVKSASPGAAPRRAAPPRPGPKPEAPAAPARPPVPAEAAAGWDEF